jgi:hypothetical protein
LRLQNNLVLSRQHLDLDDDDYRFLLTQAEFALSRRALEGRGWKLVLEAIDSAKTITPKKE